MRRVATMVLLAGCNLNQAGNVTATKRGDVSNPAGRGSPIAEQREACGDGNRTSTGAPRIRRQPYLQQVTSTGAMVGWVTATAPGERERVDITLPDGSPVISVPAAAEAGIQRRADERQMWASVTGLSPDTLYCYAIAGAAPLTERTGFRTAPAADDDAPIRVLAFGDSGGGGSDQKVLRNWMLDVPSDLIVHTGDVAYDSGKISEFEDNVFGVYHELFRNLAFYPAAGNHDYRTGAGAPFRDVFALPGDSGEKWYSYDWGRVHFVALDTESDFETQARWLDADLAATTLPWKVVYLHKPPYSSGKHGSNDRLRRLLAPVVEKHGVQLVLAGHDHNYERIKPQNGVHYFVTGGGGKGTRDVSHSSFTAFSDEVIHFVYFEVNYDELVVHAIDATGTEFDSVTIPREL